MIVSKESKYRRVLPQWIVHLESELWISANLLLYVQSLKKTLFPSQHPTCIFYIFDKCKNKVYLLQYYINTIMTSNLNFFPFSLNIITTFKDNTQTFAIKIQSYTR